jgi:hypothetical protein
MRDVTIACKERPLLLFTSLMKIEWTKSFLVDMDVNSILKILKLSKDQNKYLEHNKFISKVWWKTWWKTIISCEAGISAPSKKVPKNHKSNCHPLMSIPFPKGFY